MYYVSALDISAALFVSGRGVTRRFVLYQLQVPVPQCVIWNAPESTSSQNIFLGRDNP